MSHKITIFTQGCGSNENDFSGKLQFHNCTEIDVIPKDERLWLVFNYKGRKGQGNPVEACFNMANIYGYVTEKE